MATIKKFEDLEIWQMSAKLDKEIFDLSEKNKRLSRDFRLRDQMLSSSGSTMDNIAEGFERGGNKEFIQFLSITKGSIGELRSQVHRCTHRNYINEFESKEFINKCEEISERVSRFMTYLSKSDFKGSKYKK